MDSEKDIALRESLLSLGWLPSDLTCEEKKRLAEEYFNATKAWFESGRELRISLLARLRSGYAVPGQREWDALKPVMEEARLKAARARIAMEAHIAAHGC